VPETLLKKPVESQAMPTITQGLFHAFFIYDVADTIDLAELSRIDGQRFQKAQLDLRPLDPPHNHFKFVTPPLAARLDPIELSGLQAEVLIKIFDYGTMSIRATFPMTGSFEQVQSATANLRQSSELAERAETILTAALKQFSGALNQPHKPLLEEYFVIEINAFEQPITAATLTEKHSRELAGLLLAESRSLSALEQEDALRARFSYFENDLVLINWDCSLVIESRESAEAVESILEFANTQLVELRTYDDRLDNELDEIYKWDVARLQQHWLFGRRRAAERTARIRKLLVDIRELSDRSSNSLKIIGDAYYARVYRSMSSRLGLSDWQKQLESKLVSVNEMYHFATDQAQHARSDFLELVIIVLIVIEIILGLIGTGH